MVLNIKLFIAFLVLSRKDAFAYPKLLNVNVNDDVERIVGGEIIDITQAPYHVHVTPYYYFGNGIYHYFCGGSIISKRFILTAGHCFNDRRVNKVNVTIGTSNSLSGGIKYYAEKFDRHPKYVEWDNGVHYDVGYVKVDRDMELDGKTSKIIKLANANFDVEPRAELFIAGWGWLNESNPSTVKDLRGVKVPAISLKECKTIYDNYFNINDRMICAGFAEGGKGVCYGDSGGAAILKDFVVGIVSFGRDCARPIYPAVYARVAHPEIRQWIKAATGV